jgi:hypothetical protein
MLAVGSVTDTGQITLNFNDQPIERGVGDTANDAIKTMWPLKRKSAGTRLGQFIRRPSSRGTGSADRPEDLTTNPCSFGLVWLTL